MSCRLVRLTVILTCLCPLLVGARGQEDSAPKPPSVFAMPRIQAQFVQKLQAIEQLLQRKEYPAAVELSRQAIELMPEHAYGYFTLARAQAADDQTAALASLDQAIERGFNTPSLQDTSEFAGLRNTEEFKQLQAKARRATPQPIWPQKAVAAEITDSVALVSSENTIYDPRTDLFHVFFKFSGQVADGGPPADVNTMQKSDQPIIRGHGEIGKLLEEWWAAGTAAGNHGDFYDNHDNDHSNLNYADFPQLTRIEFSEEAKQYQLHNGLQSRMFYNGITFGNSSTALTSGPFWRSQPRLAYTDPRAINVLYAQYINNHLYMYPEHRDYDPGHNGTGGGYGDVYCANTPFVIISQGSSGSDRTFMDAIACTLAAFHPEVKQKLTRGRALMPALQMILRFCNKNVPTPDDYLTGIAHPTVFDGNHVDVMKMVQMAHAIELEQLPPVVQLRVVEEDEAVPDRDFFHYANEKLFDTPAAIARVVRSMKHTRRMVISAESSGDLNQRPLKFHWVVLRGDAEAIRIKPLNEQGSVVELLVPYHRRRPIQPDAAMWSDRVDIGAFVHNGKYFSAPAFISLFYLENESRVYDDDGRIQSVQYMDASNGGKYVDPLLDAPKNWLDQYQYDDQKRLMGWQRVRGSTFQSFTADGALVLKRDDQQRPSEARSMRYVAQQSSGKAPELEQQLGDEILYYGYESAQDLVGEIVERKPVKNE